MAVLLELSCGEIVLDLFVDDCPMACKNFLKLCKMKYYNGCLLWNVQANYIVQTGDPTATGKGGHSIFGLVQGLERDTFHDEISKTRLIDRAGLVCMANSNKPDTNRSQFFITLGNEPLLHLDGKHTVFAEVAEGFDVLAIINSLYCDRDGRPFQDVRIKHTHILDDPFDDLPDMLAPPASPASYRPLEEKVTLRIPFEENLEEGTDAKTQAELDESIRRKEAQSRAIVLEMTGDIPDAEIKPPAEVLFVCKLNPVTTDAELEIIFSRFGRIKQCEIIRDAKTGDSLNYAFIEFETEASCIEAYSKMNNVLIDDRRIKVDFSQSVSKLWNKFLLKPKADMAAVSERKQSQLQSQHRGGDSVRYDKEGRDERHRRSPEPYRDSRGDREGRKEEDRARDRGRRDEDHHNRGRNARPRSRSRDRNRGGYYGSSRM